MKGSIAVSAVYIILSILLFAFMGFNVLNYIQADQKLEAYRTSTHAVALDTANLLALTEVATGNIYIDYQIDPDIDYKITVDGYLINAARPPEDNIGFSFSIPFYFDKHETKNKRFRISKENGKHVVVSVK